MAMISLIDSRPRRKCTRDSFLYNVMDCCFFMSRATRATVQLAASTRLTAVLSPFVFGETVASNVALSGRAQVEALLLVAAYLSLLLPKWIQWMFRNGLQLVSRCSSGALGSPTSVTWLARQSLVRQVVAAGFHANAVSAIAATALQIVLDSFVLASRAFRDPYGALRQFLHDAVAAVSAGCGSVAGGCAGAALGGFLLPGVGTALGSLLGSLGGSLVPRLLRDGPGGRRAARRSRAAPEGLRLLEEENNWVMIADSNLTADDDGAPTSGAVAGEPFVGGAEFKKGEAAPEEWDMEADDWTLV